MTPIADRWSPCVVTSDRFGTGGMNGTESFLQGQSRMVGCQPRTEERSCIRKEVGTGHRFRFQTLKQTDRTDRTDRLTWYNLQYLELSRDSLCPALVPWAPWGPEKERPEEEAMGRWRGGWWSPGRSYQTCPTKPLPANDMPMICQWYANDTHGPHGMRYFEQIWFRLSFCIFCFTWFQTDRTSTRMHHACGPCAELNFSNADGVARSDLAWIFWDSLRQAQAVHCP